MSRQGHRGKRGKQKRNKAPARQLTEPTVDEPTIQPQPTVDLSTQFTIRYFNDDAPVLNVGADEFYSDSFGAAASRGKPDDNSGGYDYEFVSNPPDELICSICLSVLRDPNLTSCCGNHFCQSCISRIKNERNPCPLCQEQDYTVMLDKFFIRRVRGLKIKCPGNSHGCEWVGELRSIERHLDVSCGFVEVTCDYCQSEDILRKSFSHHRTICPARPYRCEYCGFKDKWEFITSVHHSECRKYPVECPNNCGVGKFQRRKLDKHLQEECALEEIGCEFEYAGCPVRWPRTYMALHLSESVSSHLDMVVLHFQKKLAEKDEVIEELRMHDETQTEQVSALSSFKARVHSQEREISRLRAEVQSQKQQIEELESNNDSLSGALDKMNLEAIANDTQSIFCVHIFQLLNDIALQNQDICVSDFQRDEATMFGTAVGCAALGGSAGRAMGPVGAIVGAVIGGSLGALVGFASTEPVSVIKVLSKMSEQQKQLVAGVVVKVAHERNLDVVQQLLANAILYNPAEARSLLVAVLKRLNLVVQYKRH